MFALDEDTFDDREVPGTPDFTIRAKADGRFEVQAPNGRVFEIHRLPYQRAPFVLCELIPIKVRTPTGQTRPLPRRLQDLRHDPNQMAWRIHRGAAGDNEVLTERSAPPEAAEERFIAFTDATEAAAEAITRNQWYTPTERFPRTVAAAIHAARGEGPIRRA